MKKLAILLVLILVTGCTVVRIDTTSIDNIVNVILSKENKNNNIYNRIGKGYKYYIPRGVTYVDTNDLNDKLYSNGIYYYLYIDAISYFYKSDIKYEIDDSAYYYKKISDKGYIKITEEKNKYRILFVYNYSKIEAVAIKEKIEEVILNCSYILSTVRFNDNVIKLMLNDDYFTNKEEQYDLFVRKETKDYFLVEKQEPEK